MEAKKNQIETVFIESLHSPVVKLASINDLLRLIELHNLKNVFWPKDIASDFPTHTAESMAQSGTDMAFILLDGIALAVQTASFRDFQEMIYGTNRGFNDGFSLRKAIELGIEDGEEYISFIASGFESISDFRKLMKTRIPKIFDAWEKYCETFELTDELPNPENLNSFVAQDILGISGFSKSKTETIIDAYSKGFWLEEHYSRAKKIGFKSAEDYSLALNFEIDNPKELEILQYHGISDQIHWSNFCDFRKKIKENGFNDAFGYLLSPIILNTHHGANIDIRILKQAIAKEVVNGFGIKEGPYFAFVNHMDDHDCRVFLSNHNELKRYLFVAGNQIKRRSLSELEKKSAIIDISNVVLHFCNRNEERTADSELLLNMISHLKSLDIKKLIGYADANINYDLTDDDIVKIKEQFDVFQIVKSSEPADIYILQYAENNPSCIISNDNYTDWCNERHPWRIENIPRLLMKFDFDKSKQVSLDIKEYEF